MKLRTLKKKNKVLAKSIRQWIKQKKKGNNLKLVQFYINFDNKMK